MKNGMALLLALCLIGACDDDDSKSNGKVTQVENTAINGQWKITYFYDTDSDETSKFAYYVFDFASGDVLTATKGSSTVSGSWSVTDDNSNDDSKDDFEDIDFNIVFATPADFEELSEDWEIVSLTDTTIELRHVSGGNGGTDLLTFEKI